MNWRQGLELGLDPKCRDWLFLPPQPRKSLARIAYLTYTTPAVLHALEVDKAWRNVTRQILVLPELSLFVNPLDVSSPRWIKDWLNPDNKLCAVHGALGARLMNQTKIYCPGVGGLRR